MSIKREELETTITYVRADKNASIYTCDPVVKRRLDRLCAAHPDEYQKTAELGFSSWYSCPFKRIRFGYARKATTERSLK